MSELLSTEQHPLGSVDLRVEAVWAEQSLSHEYALNGVAEVCSLAPPVSLPQPLSLRSSVTSVADLLHLLLLVHGPTRVHCETSSSSVQPLPCPCPSYRLPSLQILKKSEQERRDLSSRQ